MRVTILMRPHAAQLSDRYSERKAAGERVNIAGDLTAAAGAVITPEKA